MNRTLCTLSVAFSFSLCSMAQPTLVKQWDARFGGTGKDKLSVFQQTSDGGYILGGVSASDVNGDKTQASWNNSFDYWIVKTNATGNYQWDKRFGGTRIEVLKSIYQTLDKGYLIGGYSNSGISGDKTQANWDTSSTSANPSNDYWIVKTDSLGNKEWDKRFGGIYDDKFSCLTPTGDGGFLLGGFSSSGISGDKTQASRGSTDFWIVKMDSLGNKLWDKRYGGVNNEQLYTVCSSCDGGYLLGGYSWSQVSGDKSQSNFGAVNYCDYWVVKIDRDGTKQWDKRFGGSLNDELCYSVSTMDGGYLLGGYSWSGISGTKTKDNWGPSNTSDYWIVKIDSSGNFKWDQDFGGVEREDEFGNIIQADDGGYLFCSTSYSCISGNKSENNLGAEQTWIIKTDAQGNKVWDKTVFTSGHDEASWIVQTNDGCFAVANQTNSGTAGYVSQPNRDPSMITDDYWFAKFCDPAAQPVVQFTTTNQSICVGSCIDLTNLSHGYDSYRWYFPGASPAIDSTANPQNICYSNPGSYHVSLLGCNRRGCDSIVLTDYIHVHSQPQPFSISVVSNALVAPQVFAGYQWYFQNQPIIGATDYFLIPMQDGNYSVIVSDSSGCQRSAEIRSVNVGIENPGVSNTRVELFPNPAVDLLYVFVVSPMPDLEAQLVIRNVLGEIVMEENMKGERTSVYMKNLTPGIYFAEITMQEKTVFRKFEKL